MKTIIYGGAFNPPTVAHQLILNACTQLAEKFNGEVWLLPSGNRADKQITVPEATRLHFLEAMADATPDPDLVQVETLELHRNKNVETYDTMIELEALYPDREFHWVFGSDSTQTMATWDHGDWIIENAHIIAVNRTGYTSQPKFKTRYNVEFTRIRYEFNISSATCRHGRRLYFFSATNNSCSY